MILIKKILHKILSTCQRKNIKEKFKVTTCLTFRGGKIHYVSKQDRMNISPDSQKVDDLLGKDSPKSKQECQFLVASINQLATLVPDVKIHILGIQKLTGANTPFDCYKRQERE